MSLPFLVYCSLLKKAQYKNLRVLANVQQGAIDMAGVDQAMQDGVKKRLEFAAQFLLFSEGLLSSETDNEIANRNAVSRAYYAVHHAVRALLMFEESGDVDGHREAIEAVCTLLKRNSAAHGGENMRIHRHEGGPFLMPYPITRIPTDDAALRDAHSEELRFYIEQRLLSEYASQYPNLVLDVVVARRSDYDEVKVFVTMASLVAEAKELLRRIEDELAAEGIAILTYVRTWTGPASQAA